MIRTTELDQVTPIRMHAFPTSAAFRTDELCILQRPLAECLGIMTGKESIPGGTAPHKAFARLHHGSAQAVEDTDQCSEIAPQKGTVFAIGLPVETK
jgi:hypothetical protein